MIKATLVHFERVNTRDNMTREFRVESQGKIKSIKVASYSKGWATIVPTHICHIEDLAEMLEGIFKNGQNFDKEVIRAFEYKSVFFGVKVELDGVQIVVDNKNFQKEKIIDQYKKGVKSKS